MPKSVLIVDDDKDVLECMMDIFKQEDYVVYCAGNGYDALEVLSKVRVDVVIVDITMPNMDGFQLVYHIRTTLGLLRLPVLYNTASRPTRHDGHGHDGYDGRMDGDGSGAKPYIFKDPYVDIIMKPYNLDDILEKVKVLARRNTMRPGARPL